MRRAQFSLLLVLGMLAALLPLGAAPAFAADDHVMLTEIVVTPTGGEFIEIHNPTASAIDLSDYYLTDATYSGGGAYYYNIVTGSNAGGGESYDFHARFPDLSSIAAGEYQTVSLAGSIDFLAAYGVAPTYELFEDDASADAVPDMREALAGSIDDESGLSNTGEFVVIYTWDGVSDLVTDVDYVVWGDKAEAVDKTGVAIDGPDADTTTSAFLPDTAIASQDVIAAGAHASGESFQRFDMTEGAELGSGGNGLGGDDETSENTSVTWATAAATPGAAAPEPSLPDVVINEVDADTPGVDAAEFIELYDGGVGNVALDGLSVVLFNGSDDMSYLPAFDLDGFTTDANGYFVIGTVPGADIDVSPGGSGWLQNGADAVALLEGDAADYPNDSALPTEGVIDAIVYDTNDPDNLALLALLNPGQPQVNEDGAGDKDNHSNQRCPNGSGGTLNTDTYAQFVPTPGAANECAGSLPDDVVVNEVDADTPGNDALEFIELYDGGVGNVALDGLSVVLFNGSDDKSYLPAFDLDGFTTDANGYFVIGTVPGADIDVSPGGSGWLQNGADAVALLAGNAADYPNDSALPTEGVIDAIVYDTDDGDDAALLALLNAGQPQVNENGAGDKDNHSNQRCPNGSGAPLDTNTYTQFLATPRATNCELPPVTPDLIINEIMQNPAAVDDSAGEWFEIYNATTADVDIDGWKISDNDSDSHVIANGGPLLVPASGYLVLGNNTDSSTNGGATVDYSYGSSWYLSNSADEVVLFDSLLNEVDRVEYDGGPAFPDPTGASMALIDPALDNTDGANWCQSGAAFGDGDLGSPGGANDCATPEATEYKIHEIQGNGLASEKVGELVIIEGVVVGDFQQGDGFPDSTYDNDIDGYFVQEEDADVDGNALTSEGIFVSDNANAVMMGDVVRVTGTVAESYGLTRIESVEAVDVLVVAPAPVVSPAIVSIPVASIDDLEAFEGMSVLFTQALVISEYFNFDRYGEIVLTTERASQPTAIYEPGSTAAADLADLNSRSRITLDDGRGGQNPDPAIHPNGAVFDLSNRFRGGDTVTNLPGVMDYAYGSYKVQPTTGGTYAPINGRPAQPGAVGGDLKVATFNVLNYFTTLDDSGSICGPLGDQGCRGADNENEFTRQRDKIIDAIAVMDADVVGLMEIENDAANVAVADLVSGLNAATGSGTYAYVASGPVGPDAIRVALIYQPASVTPYGGHVVLEGAFLDPNNLGESKNRAALAQSFVSNDNGGVFTVVVNHLKSKGSECGPGDDDPEQGSCNLTRTLAAGLLADWLQTDPTGSGDADFLVIGDLNSYDMEDPIDVLTAGGYTDLAFRDIGPLAYSYVFSGQWGYLDYVMANGAAAPQVTGTTIWHINADEPDILDYDTSYKKPAQDALYEPNAFRSSDHDPVIVGLELTVTPMQAKAHSVMVLSSLLPTGDKQDDKRIAKAIKSIEDSLNPAYWVDDFHLSDKGNKVFDEEKKAVKDLMKVDGPAEADVQAVIETLVEADETLAGTAIADAIAAGGSERYIAKAQAQMEDAEYDLSMDRPDKAIDHYKRAWRYAQKALEEVPARFATFNASLNRGNAGDLVSELSTPGSSQPATIAEIIQRNRPDVLLVNEFDYDAEGVAAGLFQDNYLSIGQNGAAPIVYPYRYVAPSNTGVPSGFDLDNNGSVGGAGDAFGFGFFEGQYAFVVYSMHPIRHDKIRTFQNFLWKDMPGALLPELEGTPWYSEEELDVFRLSSKNHVDVPIRIDGETVHFLVSHPTPPVFDGDEDRNGTRNHDEIRFWADYVTGSRTARYIYDDDAKKGGLSRGAQFVIAGDLNSDPLDGDSIPGSAQQLLDHSRINDSMTPSSPGGTEQAGLQGGINDFHLSDPAFDTADFADWTPGNLRADYVLPRYDMEIVSSGVFWPEEADPLFPLVGTYPFPSSDHRLVWIDIDLDD